MKIEKLIINNDWDIILKDVFKKKSFVKLMQNISKERTKVRVLPTEKNVFNAFKISSFAITKVVIIGQDPYHKKGQAHGLAFSVPDGITPPPSLKNIFKEISSDLGSKMQQKGNLENLGEQGVLLLNTVLTVREKQPGSHQKLGWENFTNTVISKLSSEKKGLIFLLWGAYAHNKSSLINKRKHYILKTTHPSPLSAYKGFLGSKHFSKTNDILIKNNQKPINWSIC